MIAVALRDAGERSGGARVIADLDAAADRPVAALIGRGLRRRMMFEDVDADAIDLLRQDLVRRKLGFRALSFDIDAQHDGLGQRAADFLEADADRAHARDREKTRFDFLAKAERFLLLFAALVPALDGSSSLMPSHAGKTARPGDRILNDVLRTLTRYRAAAKPGLSPVTIT